MNKEIKNSPSVENKVWLYCTVEAQCVMKNTECQKEGKEHRTKTSKKIVIDCFQ